MMPNIGGIGEPFFVDAITCTALNSRALREPVVLSAGWYRLDLATGELQDGAGNVVIGADQIGDQRD
jgi:hypothetical protein